jgi:membrane-bound lytic murein transglycosylase D
VNLRLPVLFVSFALLPLAVLTQAPFAKPVAVAESLEFQSPDHTLFETYAPSDVVKEFTFPAREQWDAFATRLGKVDGTLPPAEFDSWETPPRAALFALRALPDREVYADWLSERLDELVAEKQAATPEPRLVEFILPEPEPPAAPGTKATDAIPMYDVWVSLLRDQPRPKRANEFLPNIKRIFAEEGVPEELAWLPEIESMFDPRARNRIGARGLFQFMPLTALEQGLRLRPYDERTNPEKSARAAAILLRRLHGVFDSWPLALAAYNAGESRVRRTLEAGDATTFAEIADSLPSETRLYVPKVFATLAVREGLDPAMLAAPSLR